MSLTAIISESSGNGSMLHRQPPLEGAKRICVLSQQSRGDACEVDRRVGGGRNVLLFNQNFTGRRMHPATAEKVKKMEKNKES